MGFFMISRLLLLKLLHVAGICLLDVGEKLPRDKARTRSCARGAHSVLLAVSKEAAGRCIGSYIYIKE